LFEVASDCLLEADDLNVSKRCGNAKLIDEGENGAWWDTASPQPNKGEEAWVIPVSDYVLVDECFDLSL